MLFETTSHLKLSAEPETKAPSTSEPELLKIAPCPNVFNVNDVVTGASLPEMLVEVALVNDPDTTLVTNSVVPPLLK